MMLSCPLRRALLLGGGLVVLVASAVSEPVWPAGHPVRSAIYWVGAAFIFVSISGRTWSRLYLARPRSRFVTSAGPYSVCRNPLYLFSVLGAAGVGAQTGSIALSLVAALIVLSILYFVVLEEEKMLSQIYGGIYDLYMRRVPRFWPRFSLWRNVSTVEINTAEMTRTFFEGCCMLLSIPLCSIIQLLQDQGTLPTLFRIY